MSLSLASLKDSARSTEKLAKAAAASNTKFKKDERYWELSVDAAGNGFAIIRFLDAPYVDGEDGVPFVMYYRHSFKGPGGWYIENSLTSLGRGTPDPVSEFNSKLWATGIKANQELASSRKRQETYVSNILVIQDKKKPECEGKVFLFRYGPELRKKQEAREAAANDDPDFQLFNPFNYYTGANFKLKAKNKDGTKFRTYTDSDFSAPSKVGKDEEIEKLWKASYSLQAEIAPDKFKSYDELKKRLDLVLGMTPGASTTAESASSLADEVEGAVSGGSDEVTDAELDIFRNLAE